MRYTLAVIGTHRNAALIRRRVRAAGCVCVASALSLVGVLATGCVSPAEPLGDLSSLTLGPGRVDPDVLNGQYVATLHTRWTGPIRTRMTVAPVVRDGAARELKGNTRPGVAWSFVGGIDAVLGTILAPFLFPSGMILTWDTTLPTASEPGVGSVGIGSIASTRVATHIAPRPASAQAHAEAPLASAARPIELRTREGEVLALVTLEAEDRARESGRAPDPALYTQLSRGVRARLADLLWDPAAIEPASVDRYLDDLDRGAAMAQDDAEFAFVAAFSARKNLRGATPLIFPSRRAAGPDSPLAPSDDDTRSKRLGVAAESDGGPGGPIARLRVDVFDDPATFERDLIALRSTRANAVILNLRYCPGVELSALLAACSFIDKPIDAGTVLSRAGRAKADLNSPDWSCGFALVEVSDERSLQEARRTLDLTGGVRLRLLPRPDAAPVVPPTRLAVITSRRTANTAEALAFVLQSAGAAIVGEPTMGRPLLGREAPLESGWVLRVASAEWFPPSGKSLMRTGVRPDVSCSADHAERAATDLLRDCLSTAPSQSPPAGTR